MVSTQSHTRSRGRGFGRPSASNEVSVRNANFAKLGEVLDSDVLAAATVMPEEQVAAFLKNRDTIRTEQAVQISQYLSYAGFPEGWLDIPNSQVDPTLVAGVMTLAAEATDLAPIRRANLKRLAKQFDGRYSVLADCIEILEESLVRILGGITKFDNERMGHINPLLVRAGFPADWLETPNAELTPAMVAGLEARLHMSDDEEDRPASPPAAKPSAPAVDVKPAPQKAKPAAKKPAVTKEDKPSVVATKPKTAEEPTEAAAPVAEAAPVAQPPKRIPGLPIGVQRAARPVMTQAKPEEKKPKAPPIDAETRKKYKARAAALSQLLENAKHGVKAYLWRDRIGRSLPYWANVRSGAIAFNDDLAAQVVSVLDLPTGWLDNPVFPPPTIASWVYDTPLPSVEKEALVKDAAETAKASKAKPVKAEAKAQAATKPKAAAKPAPVVPASAVAEQEPAAPVVSRRVEKSVIEVTDRTGLFAKQVPTTRKRVVVKAAPKEGISLPTATEPAAPTVLLAQPGQQQGGVPVQELLVSEPVAAEASVPVQVAPAAPVAPVAPVVRGFMLGEPGTERSEPGPVARAVADTLLEFSRSGKLTEKDAVRMLAYLHEVALPAA